MLRPFNIALTLVAVCLAASAAVHAAVSVYMTPEALAEGAAVVVEGRVARTASGFDAARSALATYVTLEVDAVHRGPADLERIVLREPGGRWGDLVHDVDAVPVYREGERVLVFLEPAADGALRTSGMFFGKFTLEESDHGIEAVRELDGQGRILRRPLGAQERLAVGDLIAVTAHADRERLEPARSGRAATWRAEPPEMPRLEWEVPAEGAALETAEDGRGTKLRFGSIASDSAGAAPSFVPVSVNDPARWTQADSGLAIPVRVDPRGNPLGDDAAAIVEVERACDAWSEVPESRVQLEVAGTYDYLAAHAASPATVFSGVNIVLFDDPYGDLPEPVDCAGVLAIGGYWRSTAWTSEVNGRSFHPAMQLYVVVSDSFECLLEDEEVLAEVLAHELGHGLGFGHSLAPDSIMRSYAYGGSRGPRLGDDDRDAAHCHYPHDFEMLSPTAGEAWAAGTTRVLAWHGTDEPGPDEGTVTLEYSADPAAGWIPIAVETPNDGTHTWTVPPGLPPAQNARVRVVRHPRADDVPAGYPAACSEAWSAPFSITPPCGSRQQGPDCPGARSGPGLRSSRPKSRPR